MGQGESGFSGCRLDLPQLSPAGAGFLPRLPTLPLACFLAPIPLPLPGGKGGFLVFLCKGLRPLHPRELKPGGTYSPCHAGHPAGAGFLPHLPTLPLACFLAPSPCPFPAGRGILSFLMQGAPPLASPGAETGRHLQPFPSRTSGGGWLSSPPVDPAFSLLSCPHPPAPSRREGGILSFLMQGAPPLASPGAEPGGTYSPCHAGHPAGACLFPRLPTLPLACFLAPYPPAPSRRGGFRVPADHGGC